MDVNTTCMTYSESGQPTGGGPCAEMAALDKENVVMRRQMERLIDERDALRSSLCLYQLQHWTMKYHLERWFDPLVGDNSEGCSG